MGRGEGLGPEPFQLRLTSQSQSHTKVLSCISSEEAGARRKMNSYKNVNFFKACFQ